MRLALLALMCSGCAIHEPAQWAMPATTRIELKEPCKLVNGKPAKNCKTLWHIDAVKVSQ